MPTEKQDLSKLTDDFVYGSLALSPVSATAAGYHEHRGVKLDGKLDDYSAAGMQAQEQFYSGIHEPLGGIKQDQLSKEDGADYQILTNQTELALLELREIELSPQPDRLCGVGWQRALQSVRIGIRAA